MSGDMPLALLDMVNSVLGGESRAEWEEEYLNLEVCNFDSRKRACGLWKQSGWVSKRVALAAACRAKAERALQYAPPPAQATAAQTMALSLEQPLTVEATPMQEVIDNTAMPVNPDQSGEHAAEFTPNAALTDTIVPIRELTIDTDAETVIPSPTRRASVSDASPPREISPRSRNSQLLNKCHVSDCQCVSELEDSTATVQLEFEGLLCQAMPKL